MLQSGELMNGHQLAYMMQGDPPIRVCPDGMVAASAKTQSSIADAAERRIAARSPGLGASSPARFATCRVG